MSKLMAGGGGVGTEGGWTERVGKWEQSGLQEYEYSR